MEQDILTRKFASQRSSQISNVLYDLFISLKKKSKKYEGKVSIHFTTKTSAPVTLNTTAKIQKVSVNSQEISDSSQSRYLLTIPKRYIKKGNNTISIHYTAEYSHSGEGFHQFIDTDKREYIYSDFEPFNAHQMFPCFDQPDMKANFSLTVQAPKTWKLISNTNQLFKKTDKKEQTTKFKQTPRISTYLFHLSAGDYHQFKSKYKSMQISVYCRQAFKKYVPVKDFFKFTKQGLNFYQEFFDYKYPFEKYDQIVVPEFNSLAMENPGAVTFSESQFPRRPMSFTERSFFANVLLHEMTHMWFGDLVTLKWWNDLWLNESFADFLSYLAMTKATEFKSGWEDFYERKAWGYFQDQLPTTHPIATQARDTKESFSSFDGISYSKGASVLKQLLFYISEDSFRKGVRKYFKKYAWKNTELSDFLTSLETQSSQNHGKLKSWFSSWIKTSGVNTIKPMVKTKNGKISKLIIHQFPSKKNNKLREHKTKIGLFYPHKISSISTNYKGRKTKIKLGSRNIKVPDFIFLNYEDWDYVKVEFDEKSMNHILNNFDKIKHSLTKQMVLGSLWELTRDAKINPKIMLNLILKESQKEKNTHTLEKEISYTASILTHYLSDKDYFEYSEKLYEIALPKYKSLSSKNQEEYGLKNAWFSAIITSAFAARDTEKLSKLLNTKLDQDKRWSILKVLASKNHKQITSLLKKELKKDKTDEGKKQAAQVESAMLKNKSKYWKMFTNTKQNKYSFDYIRGAMKPFWLRTQKSKLTSYIDKFFNNAIKIYETKSEHYGKFYSAFLFPSLYPTPELIKKSKQFLKQNPKAPKLLRKAIIEKIDGLERVYKVRQKYP